MKLTKLFILLFPLLSFALGVNAQQSEGEDAAVASIASNELILVGGATGQTGRLVVQLLREQGYRVRGLTRDKESAIKQFGTEIEWVEADVRNPDTLQPAFDGVNKFISAIGASNRDPENGPEQVNYIGVKNLVDAAKSNRVKRFVLMSSRSVERAVNDLNQAPNDPLIWRFKGEEYLRNSGLVYSVVRASGLRNSLGGENGVLLSQTDESGLGYVTRADVAAVMVECLANPDARGKTFKVFNVLADDPESWRDDFAELQTD